MPPGTSTVPPVRIVVDHEFAAIMDKTASPVRQLSNDVDVASADTAFRTLCDEDSTRRPDVVLASRPIPEQEMLRCNGHRVGGLLATNVGHIAAVIAGADDDHPLRLSADILLRALLKRIPSPADPSSLVDNPYTRWAQIDASLPNRRIEVLGPKRDSPEFLIFAIAVLEPACDQYPSIRDLRDTHRSAYEEICHAVREDGAYVPEALDSNFVQQRLWSAPGAVAVVDYGFYARNSTDLFGSLLRGAPPTRESIVDGSYAGARAIHLYVTRARYERNGTVRYFVDSYLREQRFGYHSVLIPPDGVPDRRPSRPAQLTDVRLEANKGNKP